MIAPFAFWLTRADFSGVTWRGWLAVSYNGIIGSFVAFWLVFTIIKRYGATSSVLPSYLMPSIAGIFGAALLGEIISLPLVLAAVVILLGIYFASR